MTINPWLGIGACLALIAAMMAGLNAYQRRYAPHPEWVRKLAHVGTGAVTLGLPWVFREAWPVVVMAGISITLMIARNFFSPVKRQFGEVLDGVARSSGGEIYFPLSVAVIFTLSWGDPVLFCVPMLILTLADAAAALAGVFYGRFRYEATDGRKSAEGTVTFFTVAFLSTHIPVLLYTQVGRAESVLIGLTLGLVASLLEAIAWRGLDNVIIPLGGFILLRTYLELDLATLAARFAVTLVLVVFVLVFRQHTNLNIGALLGAAFVGYLCWAVGGWQWLVPPAVLFVTYTMLLPAAERKFPQLHDVQAVFAVTSAGLLWLFLGKALRNPSFYYLFTLSFAAHLAIIGVTQLREKFLSRPAALLVSACVLKGWLLIFLPYFLLQRMTRTAGLWALAGLAATALAAIAYYGFQRARKDSTWLPQAGVAALASALGLIPIYVL